MVPYTKLILLTDNVNFFLITINAKVECYDYHKKSVLTFNKFHLILSCLNVPQNEEVVTKYVVCSSNN